MQGLFTVDPKVRQQNFFQALIPAGLQLMAAGAPSTQPGGFGRGLANAGMAFTNTMNSLNNQALQRQAFQYRMGQDQLANKRADRQLAVQEARLNATQNAPKKAPNGYEWVNGKLTYIKGGPADPAVQARLHEAKHPFVIQQVHGPDNQLMTIAVPRSSVMQGPPQRAPMVNAGTPAQTTQPPQNASVPAGSRVLSVKPKEHNASELQAAAFANRMVTATEEAQSAVAGPDGKMGTEDDFNPASGWEHAKASTPLVGNYLASKEYQQYRQAQENWVSANLRKESGAAIRPEELSEEIQKYFPQPGDSEEVVAQKARARAEAEKGMINQSQGAYQRDYGKKPVKAAGDGVKGAGYADVDAAPPELSLTEGGMTPEKKKAAELMYKQLEKMLGRGRN